MKRTLAAVRKFLAIIGLLLFVVSGCFLYLLFLLSLIPWSMAKMSLLLIATIGLPREKAKALLRFRKTTLCFFDLDKENYPPTGDYAAEIENDFRKAKTDCFWFQISQWRLRLAFWPVAPQ